ncbi:hypothetical protein AC1031_011183 [Aphanomyces cochlioides]|nr:hypothetical protein AC1031_011183 [Aphanomyces cochlioides]
MKASVVFWHKDACSKASCYCGKSSIQVLCDWISVHDGREYVNYTRWRGGTRTKDGLNRLSLASEFSQMLLREHNLIRNTDSVKCKLQELTDSYTKAKDFMNHTGEGILSALEERSIAKDDPQYIKEAQTIKDKCYKICKYWDILDEVMGDRISTMPVFLSTNESNDSVSLDVLKSLSEDGIKYILFMYLDILTLHFRDRC